LRAGLLSQPQVIDRLNSEFVCTWCVIADVRRFAEEGDELSRTLAANWKYPVDLMFLDSAGALQNKLNSYKDFVGVHGDVSTPPEEESPFGSGRSHVEVFLDHIERHFGKTAGKPPEN
jgi:hypothetical protein